MDTSKENRISTMFATLRCKGKCALIPYLTGGFPKPEATAALLDALVAGGADLIELGVPFSDPIADGPTIQAACKVALDQGTTVRKVLEILRDFRSRHATPVVLFGAYNPFFRYGLKQFAKDAREAGADGVLIPDLPVEAADEVAPILKEEGLHLILLVAPTTPPERKAAIASRAQGFLYYISVKGVTGARKDGLPDLREPIRELREVTELPIAIGFGISSPEQAASVAQIGDGVIVGSALIELIRQNADQPDLCDRVKEFVSALKAAVQSARK